MSNTNRTVERIPTYALHYLVNGDPTGLSDKDIQTIDETVRKNGIELVAPIGKSVEGNPLPYFSSSPMFGQPTEVEDCIVVMRQ